MEYELLFIIINYALAHGEKMCTSLEEIQVIVLVLSQENASEYDQETPQ